MTILKEERFCHDEIKASELTDLIRSPSTRIGGPVYIVHMVVKRERLRAQKVQLT